MPDRYHIKTAPAPGTFRRVGKFGSVDWREDCSRCTNCVKHRCVYDVYKHEGAHNRDPRSPVQLLHECKACLSCVQGCTKGLLSVVLNPEYLAMGDEYWKPDLIATTWNQADTGKIPVSGAGYRGRFSGPGFDAIWTDMSEIVRPTRDGIHGREYISTSVDIGTKPLRLTFKNDGSILESASLIEIPMPVILDAPPWTVPGSALSVARAAAAAELKILSVVAAADLAGIDAKHRPYVVPLLSEGDDIAKLRDLFQGVRMIEIQDGPNSLSLAKQAKDIRPDLLVALRVDMTPDTAKRLGGLTRDGITIFHICADLHGRQHNAESPRHIKDALREIHGALIKEGVRDKVTLIAGGGIGLPEHMAKTIICGADMVSADTILMIALGCHLCRPNGNGNGNGGKNHGTASGKAARHGASCPAAISNDQVGYATQRLVNLMGAWHNQLIEVLGAMGIREVRRLRGEVGRAIFQEDMEREAFNDLIRK